MREDNVLMGHPCKVCGKYVEVMWIPTWEEPGMGNVRVVNGGTEDVHDCPRKAAARRYETYLRIRRAEHREAVLANPNHAKEVAEGAARGRALRDLSQRVALLSDMMRFGATGDTEPMEAR